MTSFLQALLACVVLAGCAWPQTPPLPAAEFRAAWVATVDNIDWPSKPGLPTADAKRELLAIVERAASLRLNALVFQVRPAGDAFYDSPHEPWSEWLTGKQGKAPETPWDPLTYLTTEAHQRGIEVHAWFNPFRARHRAATTPDDPRHATQAMPSACIRYGDQIWMDPGDPRCVEWSLTVIEDVVARYDIDGIHLDDYFYPYPEKKQRFNDDRSYARYQQTGGPLERSDWRRANIESFLKRLYTEAHQRKPWIKVGLSPFGIARPGVPRGIQAGIDQYEVLAADVLSWQKRGLCDYLSPQLYWPIDQKAQSYAVLLPWWFSQNPLRRHVWPGLSAANAATQKAPWREGEIPQQIEMIRAQGPDAGYVLYSFRALRGEVGNQVAGLYREPAVVPASPWLKGTAPSEPQAELARASGELRVTWQKREDIRNYVVQIQRGRRWQTLAVRGSGTGSMVLPQDTTAVAVRGLAANGLVGAAKVLTITP